MIVMRNDRGGGLGLYLDGGLMCESTSLEGYLEAYPKDKKRQDKIDEKK